MKDELTLWQLKGIIEQIERFQAQHPKANVTYDTGRRRIDITYPLPRDMFEITDIKINSKS